MTNSYRIQTSQDRQVNPSRPDYKVWEDQGPEEDLLAAAGYPLTRDNVRAANAVLASALYFARDNSPFSPNGWMYPNRVGWIFEWPEKPILYAGWLGWRADSESILRIIWKENPQITSDEVKRAFISARQFVQRTINLGWLAETKPN
jgi:hypothetical protein